MTLTRCRVCRSSRLRRLHPLDAASNSGAPFWIVACDACGLHMLHPVPGSDDLDVAQDDAYFEAYADPAAATMKALDVDRMLERVHVPAGATVLEVGCAAGALLEHLLARGYDAEGIELNGPVAEVAARKHPGRVVQGNFTTFPFARSFDLMLMVDVLEHLPDPVGGLARAADLLNPGGTLLVVTPDAGSRLCRVMGRRWLGYYLAHLNCLSRDALRVAATRAGLTLAAVSSFTKTVTLGYAIEKASYRFSAFEVLKPLGQTSLRNLRFRVVDDSMLAVFEKPDG